MFSFDGSGNPTMYSSPTGLYTNATFGFDPEDRLTNSPAISGTFSAAYDGNGMRISKSVSSSSPATTYYLYDGSDPVIEETYSGGATTVSAASGWGADGLRARYVPSDGYAYDFSYDPQGSVVQRQTRGAFTAGRWAYDTAIYEAYGAKRSDYGSLSPAANHQPGHMDPAGFGGQYGYYTDTETGLLCLTHRYYDPGTGKFLNRDPIGYAGGANLYGFADGNPVNEEDEDGTRGVPTLPTTEPDVQPVRVTRLGRLLKWLDVIGESPFARIGFRSSLIVALTLNPTRLADDSLGPHFAAMRKARDERLQRNGRLNIAKPRYKINEAHDDRSTKYNKKKDPLPRSEDGTDLAEIAYRRAVPAPNGAWWASSGDGAYYRYSPSSNGETHFNGIFYADKAQDYVGDRDTWDRINGR